MFFDLPPRNTSLKLLLLSKDIKQVDLALLLGKAPSRVSLLCNGVVKPTQQERELIRKAFGVDPDELWPED